ncbi:MAG TPA: gamma-glutamyl-gamma-aminobutyrate hydrolase family protein [Verrucomicrobiae bacterium]|nr:gamma-glutamyl-gamma-aminobutyrate hydrolase family protein [Verrucomicrobiae bacterium]
MQPIIGITAGEVVNHDYPLAPIVQGQQYTYIDAIVRAGGVPIILPLVGNNEALQQLYKQCDGILFSGGNDIDPGLYDAAPSSHTKQIAPHRDEQETQLLKWALKDDKPLLGICRGMQLLNITLGGTLYQDIATELPSAEAHFIELYADRDREHHIAHQLQIKPGTKMATILGIEKLDTNAYHHQAIRNLGKDLVATAWASDGVIEGIELPGKRFVIGVQSHPESLEADIEPHWQVLFSAFIEEAKK